MIVLNNYNKLGTYIILDSTKYSIISEDKVDLIRQGVGGFSEEGELLGIYIYIYMDKFFFLYNNDKYETNPDYIICTNTAIEDGMHHFRVKINDKTICKIIYKPYISPSILALDEDEDEFDFLLYLSKILENKDSILNFIKGMNSLRKI